MTSYVALPKNDLTDSSGLSPGVFDQRLPSLTGLRFAAALLVFGFHIQAMHVFRADSAGERVVGHLFGHGAVGVSFFFILSGFVLTWSARSGERARRIWRRRAAKIYPNHLVTAAIAIAGLLALPGVADAGSSRLAGVLPNLLLLQAWDPNPAVYFGLNTVSWSLSCEALFYFCFPFLLRLLGRVGERALWPLAAGLAAIVWCLPLATFGSSSATSYWLIYVFPPSRLAEFCLGMVLARIVRVGRWPRIPAWVAAVLLVAAYIAVGYVPTRFGYVAATVIPLALLVPALATADVRGRGSLWSRRRAVWLGEVSFAFYLIHQLVIRYTLKVLSRAVGDPGTWSAARSVEVAVAMVAMSLLAAWVLYRVVEQPLNRRLRGTRARPKSQVDDNAAVPAVGVVGRQDLSLNGDR